MFETSTCSTIACILRIVDSGYITSPAASLPGSLADWLPASPRKALGGTRSGALKYGCGSSEPVASNLPSMFSKPCLTGLLVFRTVAVPPARYGTLLCRQVSLSCAWAQAAGTGAARGWLAGRRKPDCMRQLSKGAPEAPQSR